MIENLTKQQVLLVSTALKTYYKLIITTTTIIKVSSYLFNITYNNDNPIYVRITLNKYIRVYISNFSLLL